MECADNKDNAYINITICQASTNENRTRSFTCHIHKYMVSKLLL